MAGLKKKSLGKSRATAQNSKMLLIAIVIVGALTFFGSLALFKSMFQKDVYYVLNTDVPSRTLITADMLEPISTNKGSAPPSLDLATIQGSNVYSKYALTAGIVPHPSNMGTLDDISSGVPDEWVVTSFAVAADDAVGGRIQRGVYFDMLVITDSGSYYPFVNVLALDNTVSLNNASSAAAADTQEARDGQTEQYFVGMSPSDAAKLHSIMEGNGTIKLLLSPRQNEYAAPQVSEYEGLFTYNYEDGPVWPGENPEDGTERTDYMFNQPNRDSCGIPEGHPDYNADKEQGQCGTLGNSAKRIGGTVAPETTGEITRGSETKEPSPAATGTQTDAPLTEGESTPSPEETTTE